jgi:cyclopropane fatty-acyl-phospholipid synthase-like methyltransferase
MGEVPESAAASWEAVYVSDRAPWDIGRPQAALVQLADAGEIGSPALDSGCGTGEHALMLAEHGLTAMGIDVAPTAIRVARRKALERGLDVAFEVGDVLALDRLDRTFATVVDSGVFHVFGDADRARYVTSLATVLDPGGVLYLMCFSELTAGDIGPRRVTQAELRAAFAHGWRVDRIDASRFDVRADFPTQPVHAWLARIVRT